MMVWVLLRPCADSSRSLPLLVPATSVPFIVTPGASCAKAHMLFDVGIAFISSRLKTVERWVCVTSTMGDAPDTVTVSWSELTLSVTSKVAVKLDGSWMPSRTTRLKPSREKVTLYSPGRRSTMEYWPCPSVTAVRRPSISAGLAASTTAPGSTAPELSRT